MKTRVPSTLLSSLVLVAVFVAPLAPVVQADTDTATATAQILSENDTATSTEEFLPVAVPDQLLQNTTTSPEIATLVESATTTPREDEVRIVSEETPLPQANVLYDASYVDESWNLYDTHLFVGEDYEYDYYEYYPGAAVFDSYSALEDAVFWTTTGTTTTVRVQTLEGFDCSNLPTLTVKSNVDLGEIYLTEHSHRNYLSFNSDGSAQTNGAYCDFTLYGEGIPPGTPLVSLFLSVAGAPVAGSSNNPGVLRYEQNVVGGFAFQLCGAGGCSGGFGPPVLTPTTPTVSNVLFLPGIKGSRLYHEVSVCDGVPGVCEETLWEPYGDVLARKLLLDFDGTSIDEVFAKEGEIIDEAGGQKFYSSFIKDMNELQASSTYSGGNFKWRAAAYDWRLSLPDIINSGAKYGDRIYYDQATSTPYIEQTLRELAHASPTQKVTIVAHSNGGLVAKALLQKLGDTETAELIDKIIFVGVPQTGAPQALGALLFGYGESLPGKIFLPDILISKEVSRELAENSPMAYHLMPSSQYLSDVQDPIHSIIGFSGSHLYQTEQTAYGPSIDTVTELDNFLLAREGGRIKPAYTDLTEANILNQNLISYANETHTSLDSWVPPASVTLYQIAGWGANTVSGIDFYDEQKLFGTTIGHKRQYRPIFVEDGDKVVPVPSALMMSTTPNVHSYWLNLAKAKKEHGDLFESQDLRDFLSNSLMNISELPHLMSETAPVPEPDFKKLVFQLHSPLTLGLHDSSGNYTGLNDDGSVSEDVDGVEYGEFGDVKYLIAPAGVEYELVMHGQQEGTFSLDIQEQTGNTVTSTATIADVPTTASTIARLTITNGLADASSLAVDTDGNGITDTTVTAQAGGTVNYVSQDIPTPSTSSGSSSNNKQSTTTTVSDVTPSVLTTFVPAAQVVASVPATLKAAVADATSVEITPGTIQKQETMITPDISQTASVYNALAPLTEWLKTLLYNIFKGLRYIIQSLH